MEKKQKMKNIMDDGMKLLEGYILDHGGVEGISRATRMASATLKRYFDMGSEKVAKEHGVTVTECKKKLASRSTMIGQHILVDMDGDNDACKAVILLLASSILSHNEALREEEAEKLKDQDWWNEV